jgi:hypothetical protein
MNDDVCFAELYLATIHLRAESATGPLEASTQAAVVRRTAGLLVEFDPLVSSVFGVLLVDIERELTAGRVPKPLLDELVDVAYRLAREEAERRQKWRAKLDDAFEHAMSDWEPLQVNEVAVRLRVSHRTASRRLENWRMEGHACRENRQRWLVDPSVFTPGH